MPKPAAPADVRRQALSWLLARHSGAWTDDAQRAFADWLAEDEAHRREYQSAQQLWDEFDTFKTADFPQRQAALAYRPVGDLANVVRFPGAAETGAVAPAKPNRPVRSRAWRQTAAAVAASVLLAVGAQTYSQTGVSRYRTAIGEQQSIFLADGSRIVLNTDTELAVDIGLLHRSVLLMRGEALFTVSHNPLRPFEVDAGSGKIRDIGTQFNVYRQPERVDVTVLEGEVDIITPTQSAKHTLTAGRSAFFNPQGAVQTQAAGNPGAATAWEQGKLVFNEQALEQVLAQIARYHAVQFDVADPKLRELKVSGTFKTANLQLLLETLEAGFPVKAQIIDTQHVRLSRAGRS